MPQVKQEGGRHYDVGLGCCPNCGNSLQHWDWAAKREYLAMRASAYLERHQDKGGFLDLLKGLSFVIKMMTVFYPDQYKDWREQEDRKGYDRFMDNHPVKGRSKA